MLRGLIIAALTSGAAFGALPAAHASCAAAPILIQDVTVVDATGEWDDQDIFIEHGRISAIGSGLELESASAVMPLHRPGAVVRPAADRPAPEAGVLVIRTAFDAGPRTSRTILTAGVPANLVVYRNAAGAEQVELEIRDGRILGHADTCQG